MVATNLCDGHVGHLLSHEHVRELLVEYIDGRDFLLLHVQGRTSRLHPALRLLLGKLELLFFSFQLLFHGFELILGDIAAL